MSKNTYRKKKHFIPEHHSLDYATNKIQQSSSITKNNQKLINAQSIIKINI